MQRSEPEKLPYFWPKWFKALLLGRLSFGDTFWAGLFGSALIFVPFGVIVAMMVSVIAPGALDPVLIVITGFYTVYLSLLTRVVFITGWKSKDTGGWRWFGMFYVVAQTALQYGILWELIVNGSDLGG